MTLTQHLATRIDEGRVCEAPIASEPLTLDYGVAFWKAGNEWLPAAQYFMLGLLGDALPGVASGGLWLAQWGWLLKSGGSGGSGGCSGGARRGGA